MKKFTYLLATAALLAACSGNQGYTVKGSVEGAADGDTVYMQAREGRQLVKLDSAVITNGEFQFKGTKADSLADVRYLTYKSGENSLAMDFFLENGNIQIHLSTNDDAATGTPTNDAYQVIRAQVNELTKQMSAIYKSLSDSTLTDEQREEASKNIEATEEKMMGVMKEGITNNITNAAGIYLLKQNFYYMDVEDLDPLMAQIPAAYANDETIIRIKDNVEKMKATAVGQKFTDFEMQTPDGKAVKLSDYVGKGKVTLIDFWASWCGPCRREMPNLVEAYKKYKNKGFEIVGVSLDRDAEAWKNGIKQLKITWPQMSDLKYWDCEGAKLYAVSSIPHTVLVDGEGTILARGLHGEELQEKIAEALK
ncbi:MAG TPA: AhpC/TSA family protein [Candidatus Bacteroides avicola]|jgi:peroxiredoxin|uniref:AhpC/TSA family protein n=1 Tax=Candidatus Bacteroides avicola TaxID=2838468 RepID=A0A9D2HUJ3_9BACE|nr:TlpA disulfide reductase family protein [Mediterranea sp. An20]MBW9201411.1 AhpC/TSA family protein [Bacteroidales bacterium SW292]OUP07759.1 thiol:disulfide interchange protein [Mediterranea sp. An20]HJA84611.1 AhpC/TSA family protein [Candidatus Bacteroides avicola]